jgi:hypothetical protein
VCYASDKQKAETHPSTPLKRGIARIQGFFKVKIFPREKTEEKRICEITLISEITKKENNEMER